MVDKTVPLTTDELAAATCARCASGSMHYIKDCDSICSKTGQGHCEMRIINAEQFLTTYANYGYWSGQCLQCSKRWEVDSSG